MTVRDIMIPRAQMDCVSIDDEPAEFIPFVLETRALAFPGHGENKDDVVGILLAKELLNYYANPEGFNLRDTLRPGRLRAGIQAPNVLLRDFRANRNHIAIVRRRIWRRLGTGHHRGCAGQIVGDIEDEYDFDEAEDNIIPEGNGRYRVKARDRDRRFQRRDSAWNSDDDQLDTVGGAVLRAFGRLPKRGETVTIDGFRASGRRAQTAAGCSLTVERVAPAAGTGSAPRIFQASG